MRWIGGIERWGRRVPGEERGGGGKGGHSRARQAGGCFGACADGGAGSRYVHAEVDVDGVCGGAREGRYGGGEGGVHQRSQGGQTARGRRADDWRDEEAERRVGEEVRRGGQVHCERQRQGN